MCVGGYTRYLLSYLQSVLLLEASAQVTDAELLDQPLDIHKLGTFEIIDRARCVERGWCVCSVVVEGGWCV